MGWNWKNGSMESADSGGAWTPPGAPPQAPVSQPAQAQRGAMNPFDPNQNPVLGFVFGDGSRPGVLGTGQYQADPRAGQIAGIDTTRARADYGYNQALGANPGQQYANGQMALAQDLYATTQGQGPSVAQEQLRQGTQANLAASVAAANSVRGPGAAAAGGQLAARQAMAGQQMASDAGLLRAQEVTQARGLLAQVTGQGREQDMAAEAQRQQIAMSYLQLGFSAEQAAQQAAMDLERLKQSSYYKTGDNQYRLVKDVAGAAGQAAGLGAGGAPKP